MEDFNAVHATSFDKRMTECSRHFQWITDVVSAVSFSDCRKILRFIQLLLWFYKMVLFFPLLWFMFWNSLQSSCIRIKFYLYTHNTIITRLQCFVKSLINAISNAPHNYLPKCHCHSTAVICCLTNLQNPPETMIKGRKQCRWWAIASKPYCDHDIHKWHSIVVL